MLTRMNAIVALQAAEINPEKNRRIVFNDHAKNTFNYPSFASWLNIFSSRCNLAERITLLIVEAFFSHISDVPLIMV